MFFLKGKYKDAFNALSHAMGTAGTMGLHLVSGVLVGLAMGYFLDRWLGTGPWLLLIFLVLGIIAGFMNLYRDAKKVISDQSRDITERDDK